MTTSTTSARELSARLSDLLRDERGALAEFLLALADFDRLRLWVDLGYSSLFDYLHRELGMSKGAAFYRLTAAQVIQRHPAVVEPLRDGRLCLTTIVELSKVLTAENLEDVLPRFFHLSKREAQEVRVELRPEPSVPARTIVTPVRSSPADLGFAPSGDLRQPAVHPANHLDANSATQAQEGPPPAERSRMTVEPKTAEESRLHITVPRRLLRKLELGAGRSADRREAEVPVPGAQRPRRATGPWPRVDGTVHARGLPALRPRGGGGVTPTATRRRPVLDPVADPRRTSHHAGRAPASGLVKAGRAG